MTAPILYPIDRETLASIQQAGYTCDLLEARLAYSTTQQILAQHLGPLTRCISCGFMMHEETSLRCAVCAPPTHVWPNMMNPQASGRMSVSRPPLGNFTARARYGPEGIRDVVRPPSGWKWITYDLEAVEARKISHYCRDPVDAEAFRRGWDVHTATAQRMLSWPEFSFEPTKANLWRSEAGQEWCARVGHILGTEPYHSDHRIRTLVKNVRYTLQYAKNVKALHVYAVEMRMSKSELERYGTLYLKSKPWLVAFKNRTWDDCWRTHEARTFLGRRRKLVGLQSHQEKEGLNHIIQGGVADMLKVTIILVRQALGRHCMVFQTHDGNKFLFKRDDEMPSDIKELVDHEWIVDGRPVRYPAEWKTIYHPGEEP